MKNSTILIAVGKDAPLDDLARKLETIRAIPAQAAIVIVGEVPQFPAYAVGVAPYGGVDIPPEWQDAMSESKAALIAKQDAIETLLQQHDIKGGVAVIATDPTQVSDIIAQRAILCDFALVSDDLRDPDFLFRHTAHGILFQSPVGMILNSPTAKELAQAQRIFVAWTPELHAARAVHQALPMLRQADEITIGMVDPVMAAYSAGEDPGVDLAKWLSHHGCKVTVQQYPSGGHEIGQCILDRSKEFGADLVVMGAYSHSRAREAVFGGTTRAIIDQTEQAVILAH